MRILIIAYACEPDRGSESEVGWRWSIAAARMGHDVVVFTRANNREKIEAASADYEGLTIRFEYHDAPRVLLALKRRYILPRIYYLAWQASAYRRLRAMTWKQDFDVAHHLTYVSARFPSVLALLDIPFVWGPIGGLGRVARGLRSELEFRGRVEESVRDFSQYVERIDPLWWLTVLRCRRALVTDSESLAKLPAVLRRKAMLAPAIGVDSTAPAEDAFLDEEATPKILMVGELTARKGQALALRALARVHGEVDWVCDIVGQGPDRSRLEGLAADLGIHDRVAFLGSAPRQRLLSSLRCRPVFVLLSFRESGGMALLEAAAAGCALVFLDTGGPHEIFGAYGSGAVAPGDPAQVIRDAGDQLERYLVDDEARASAGARAAALARNMDWAGKARYLSWIYATERNDAS